MKNNNRESRFSTRQYMLNEDYEVYYYNDLHFTSVGSHSHDYYEFYFFEEGDVVLDCFSGSGSTAIAALKLGRRALSMEIDEHWISASAEKFKMISDFGYTQFPNNCSALRKNSGPQEQFLF